MNAEKFREATAELLVLAGSRASSNAYTSVNLDVDGVAFSLIQSDSDGGASMVIFCDFGAPPAKHRSELAKILLTTNVITADSPGRESFCLNRASGHILASCVFPLQNANGTLMLNLLQHYAARARKWQEQCRSEPACVTPHTLLEDSATHGMRPPLEHLLGP